MSHLPSSDRKYVWGNATVKKPLNTVSTQTGSSRLSKSADSRLDQYDRPTSRAVNSSASQRSAHRSGKSRTRKRNDMTLTSIENSTNMNVLPKLNLKRTNSENSLTKDSEEVLVCETSVIAQNFI